MPKTKHTIASKPSARVKFKPLRKNTVLVKREFVKRDDLGEPVKAAGCSYHEFLGHLNARFQHEIIGGTEPLFTTRWNKGVQPTASLVAFFRSWIPMPQRQVYHCRTCAGFLRRYGSLVTVDESTGRLRSAVWSLPLSHVPQELQKAVQETKKFVEQYAVLDCVFVFDSQNHSLHLGHAMRNGFEHMSVTLPMQYVETFTKARAYGQEYRNLLSLLKQVTQKQLAEAGKVMTFSGKEAESKLLERLLWLEKARGLFRNDVWLKEAKNCLYRQVALAPAGFTHVSSGLLGMVLRSVKDSPRSAMDQRVGQLKEALDPLNYRRPKAAPSEQLVAEAEKVFAQMDAVTALRRRFARDEDIQWLWKPDPLATVASKVDPKPRSMSKAVEHELLQKGVHVPRRGTVPTEAEIFQAGIMHLSQATLLQLLRQSQKQEPAVAVFAGIETKAKQVTMTGRALVEILSKSGRVFRSLDILVPASHPAFTSLTTASTYQGPLSNAPYRGSFPILKWDMHVNRNPASWYFWAGDKGPKADDFELVAGSWTPLRGICLQPNLWGNVHDTSLGWGVMFAVQGAREKARVPLGLFPEMLKFEFHAYGRVLEAYMKVKHVEQIPEEHGAAGLLCQESLEDWQVQLRVTNAQGLRYLLNVTSK